MGVDLDVGGRKCGLCVADVMTGLASLDAVDHGDLKIATVGNLIATLKKHGRNHLLVAEGAPPRVRGVVSRAQIERQLGHIIAVVEVADNVAEIGLDGKKGNAVPMLKLPTPDQRATLDRLAAAIDRTERRLDAPWARAPLSVLAGLLTVRCFILYHDHMHGSLLRGSKLAAAMPGPLSPVASTRLRLVRRLRSA